MPQQKAQQFEGRIRELEERIERLQKDNSRYASTIMARNARILELEDQLN